MSRQLTVSNGSNNGKPQCVMDRRIVNEDTMADIMDLGISFYAPLCGRNRGVFVLDPPDGHTYGCIALPSTYAALAGVDTEVALKDTNAIKEQFVGGNLTALETVDLLDFFVQAVYQSTADVAETPLACDVGGLAQLTCGEAPPSILADGSPLRAATIAGVFVPAPWMGQQQPLTLDEAQTFYTAQDFSAMVQLGLNAVQIPVYSSAFVGGTTTVGKGVGNMLGLVQDAGLAAILVLVPQDEDSTDEVEAVTAAATFAAQHMAVVGLTLPSSDTKLVAAARTVVASLPLLLPTRTGDLSTLHADNANVYAALDLSHTDTVGNVASSTSQDDRMKMFYHEAISCTARSPIEYAACYKKVPVLVASGFNLAIDDCVSQDSSFFKDYGQCDRFDETIGSNWWWHHRKSFAARQVFAYERGLGWSFAAWKLLGDDQSTGMLDTPAKLLSLKDVAAAGLMPSLTKKHPAALACLNPPQTDFILGDATLAPTAAPPPDCGNGWWNFTSAECDYWVPPPPPKCVPDNTTTTVPFVVQTANSMPSHQALGFAALGGAAVTAVLGAILLKMFGNQRRGYSQIP